ncbi:Mov34/MPN/PAD-1 family protein [Wukongibacter sp. M2B1]|uniref:Mov34/MPN/PAD-1 family protein n=1 Tax=Wukongibacter sp. M2B1 TaxID=3088895 RepID=UPI003D79DCF7
MKKYRIDKNTIVTISDLVIEKINKYRQLNRMYESGGILLGRVKIDYSEYIIDDISEPCSRDRRYRYGFIRNKDKAQKIINEAFDKSNGVIQYLGEWHTHPECNPTPSIVDRNLINNCSEKIENVSEIIFMIILGYDGSMYIGYKRKGNKKMTKILEI